MKVSETSKLRQLLVLLREYNVLEYVAADGTKVVLAAPIIAPAAVAGGEPSRERVISEAGRFMENAMNKINPEYRQAFEIR